MPMPKKADPEKLCAYCEKKLQRKRINGRLEDRTIFLKRKYCDRICMAQAFIQEGVTKSALHKRAQMFVGEVCEICRETENLGVHHKDSDPTNNVANNLMTLCGSCHTRWHWQHGKRPWKRQSVCRVCGEPARKLDMCQKHYQRYRKYGDPLLTRKRRGSGYELVRESPGVKDGPRSQER